MDSLSTLPTLSPLPLPPDTFNSFYLLLHHATLHYTYPTHTHSLSFLPYSLLLILSTVYWLLTYISSPLPKFSSIIIFLSFPLPSVTLKHHLPLPPIPSHSSRSFPQTLPSSISLSPFLLHLHMKIVPSQHANPKRRGGMRAWNYIELVTTQKAGCRGRDEEGRIRRSEKMGNYRGMVGI